MYDNCNGILLFLLNIVNRFVPIWGQNNTILTFIYNVLFFKIDLRLLLFFIYHFIIKILSIYRVYLFKIIILTYYNFIYVKFIYFLSGCGFGLRFLRFVCKFKFLWWVTCSSKVLLWKRMWVQFFWKQSLHSLRALNGWKTPKVDHFFPWSRFVPRRLKSSASQTVKTSFTLSH